MKLKDFKEFLASSEGHDEDEVVIEIDKPSLGCKANTKVEKASFGFDWNSGKIFLKPEKHLSEKTRREDVYQSAVDLLMRLATNPLTQDSYETKKAKKILLRAGYKEEDLQKFKNFFHKEE